MFNQVMVLNYYKTIRKYVNENLIYNIVSL